MLQCRKSLCSAGHHQGQHTFHYITSQAALEDTLSNCLGQYLPDSTSSARIVRSLLSCTHYHMSPCLEASGIYIDVLQTFA